MNRKTIILIVLGFVVFTGIFTVVLLSTSKVDPEPNVSKEVEESTALKIQILKESEPLSSSGEIAKRTLLDTLGGRAGTIVDRNTFRAGYLASADEFLVEIKTLDTERAKVDAIQWFVEQGFVERDLCALPVVFDFDVLVFDEATKKGVQLDPLASVCNNILD